MQTLVIHKSFSVILGLLKIDSLAILQYTIRYNYNMQLYNYICNSFRLIGVEDDSYIYQYSEIYLCSII